MRRFSPHAHHTSPLPLPISWQQPVSTPLRCHCQSLDNSLCQRLSCSRPRTANGPRVSKCHHQYTCRSCQYCTRPIHNPPHPRDRYQFDRQLSQLIKNNNSKSAMILIWIQTTINKSSEELKVTLCVSLDYFEQDATTMYNCVTDWSATEMKTSKWKCN